MAHVLVLRIASSFVQARNAIYGAHEVVEHNIACRKYPDKEVRSGYTMPFASEYKLIDYRKKEHKVPEFINDMNCRNLNPIPNNITLWKIFKTDKKSSSKLFTVNKLFMIIQWLFKWINKKKTSSIILLISAFLGIMSFFIALILIGLLWINPLKPILVCDKPKKPFINQWNYNFTIGMLKDPTRTYPLNNKDVVIKDVL